MHCNYDFRSRESIDSQQSEKKQGKEGRLPEGRRKVTREIAPRKTGVIPGTPDASKSQSSHRVQRKITLKSSIPKEIPETRARDVKDAKEVKVCPSSPLSLCTLFSLGNLSHKMAREKLDDFYNGKISYEEIMEMASGLEVNDLMQRADLENFKELFQSFKEKYEPSFIRDIVGSVFYCCLPRSTSPLPKINEALDKINSAEQKRNENGVELLAVLRKKGPNIEEIKGLLQPGADLNEAKLLAVLRKKEPYIEEIKALIKAGANLEVRCEYYQGTPLWVAVANDHTETVKILLQAGANQEVRGGCWNDITPLWVAVENGHTETVKVLLQAKDNLNTDTTTRLLHLAAKSGHAETVKVLLQAGANPNACDGYFSNTSLHLAAERGHTETVKVLRQAGADPNIKNEKGDTALFLAMEMSHVETVKALIKPPY